MHQSNHFAAGAGAHSSAARASHSNHGNPQGLLDAAANLITEPAQQREEILNNYRAELLPSSFLEEHFVGELAAADWRLKQLDRVELGVQACLSNSTYNKVVNLEFAQRFTKASMAGSSTGNSQAAAEPCGPVPLSETSGDIRTIVMGASWVNNSSDFALLVRCRAQARRDHDRALKHLKDLRTGKAGYLPKQHPEKDETKPTQVPQPQPPATEKYETNPNVTDYQLKWDDPNPFVVYDPTLWDRLAQPVKSKKQREDEFNPTSRFPYRPASKHHTALGSNALA